MPFTSLVIWLENSESFMKVIIGVIYRSHQHTHSPMSLCYAVLRQKQKNLKETKTFSATKPSFSLFGSVH